MEKFNWLSSTPLQKVIEKDIEFWDYLSNNAYLLTKGALKLPISLEPFVISEQEYEYISSNLTLILNAAKKICQAWYKDKDVRKLIKIHPSELPLVMASENDDFVGVVRIDSFFTTKPNIVEINADCPGGFFMHSVTSDGIVKSLPENSYGIQSVAHSILVDKLMTYISPDKKTCVFIGYDENSKFIDEIYLAKKQLNDLGWNNILIGPLQQLEVKDDFLYFNQKKIELLRRASPLYKFREHKQLLLNIAKCIKNDLKVLNSFKMRLLGHKSLLVALHKESLQKKYLSEKEINAIKEFIPLSLRVTPEIVQQVSNEKDQWVLKPSDLAMGDNIFVGKSLEKEKWETRLLEASKYPDNWIIQKYINIPSETFNLLVDEKISSSKKYFDFNSNAAILNEEVYFGNTLVRFSESPVLNVAKGGGLTYAFRKLS